LHFIKKIFSKDKLHFLHIGKTAGSSVKYALQKRLKLFWKEKYQIVCHPHSFTLEDIPAGERFFFIVRDPIKRFVSGFYSRKRKGQPRYYYEWSEKEREAFSNFVTPNELGEALSDSNEEKRDLAREALQNIQHVKSSYWDWFKSHKYFETRLNDLLSVLRLDSLEVDFQELMESVGVTNAVLPEDPVLKHKNPSDVDKTLSEEALKNLKRWYQADYDFITLLYKKGLI
jgi:hypothetical protein